MKRIYFGLLIALFVHVAGAQSVDPSRLSMDRIFNSGDFATERFGPAVWMENGSGYTTVEASASGSGDDIVLYDPASGVRSVLVSAEDLTPAGRDTPLEIHNYSWSPDGTFFVLFTNSKRVWRQNTRGDYWVLDMDTKRLHQLGGTEAPESTLMFAKISPDGKHVAYVREHNLYLEHLDSGDITALTTDGTEDIINGTFDWVHEEEFFLRDGFRWSPDSKRIAFWQLDAAGVGEFLMINNTDSLYSFTIPLQYPKAGTQNSSSRVGVVDLDGGEITWVKDNDDPRNHYLARMEWADNSTELIIQHLNRLQNTNTVLMATASTGETRTVFVDRDDAWLDVVDDVLWLDGGKQFTWLSEQDGYRHAYLVDRQSGRLTLVSDGDYEVLNVAKIDINGGYLYFISSFEGATERYLYRLPLKGGDPERLTPAGQSGWHGYQISPDAKWAIHTYSQFRKPPVISVVSLPDHKVIRKLVGNERAELAVNTLNLGDQTFFKVDIGDGYELDAYYILPPDFDATEKYPVLFHVYGEPWSQTVTNQWGGRNALWHHYLAQQGYVVMSVDNRGTPGPHGREWRKMIYGEIGTIAAQDQAAALEKIGQMFTWVDSDRIGIWGWSGGGSMTLNMLFRYPDLYKVGMSVAPVPDQRLYDTIYQERYMGLPQDNARGYKMGSPITYAEGLKGDLLLVHGTGDDNVHYQGSELLMNRLIELGKPFDVMVYPNRSHGIYEGPGTTRHLFDLLTRHLTDHLKTN